MTFDTFTRDDSYVPGRIVVHARTEGQPLSSGASYVFTPEGEFERGGRRVSLDEMNAIRAAAGFAAIALYQMEFPDFSADDMPAIPAGFEDASWHNESCPSFRNEALQLTLYIDFARPEDREFPECVRFGLVREEWPIISDADRAHLAETDDWSEVLAHVLAVSFAAELKADLTPEEWATMQATNATPDYQGESGPCASHDVCDANMPMAAAFEKVTGREPATSWETNVDGSPCDVEEMERATHDTALWNAAWDIAKADYLTDAATTDDLTKVFAAYVKREGIALEGDAMEMLMTDDLRADQRAWISDFVERWDAVQAREDS